MVTIDKLVKGGHLETGVKFSREYLKEHPKAKSKYYYCLVPEDKDFDSGLQYAPKGRKARVGVYTEAQNGYKQATERLPQFDNICEICGQVIKDEL